MNKILDLITKNLENGNYLLIIIVFVVVTFFKFETIFKSFDRIKKNKLNYLFELEKKDNIDGSIKENINATINNHLFRITTGIDTHQYMREKILKLYHKHKGTLSLRDFKLSQKYLKLEKEKVIINFTKFDTVFYYYNLLIGFIMFVLGTTMLVIFLSTSITAIQIITFVIIGIGFIIVSFLPLKDALSYKTAKKIKDIIEK